jgi:hypothetical protein
MTSIDQAASYLLRLRGTVTWKAVARSMVGSLGSVCLAACGGASVSDCRVTRTASGGIVFEAQAHNRTSQPIAKFFVLVSTNPPAGLFAHDSLYELDGLVPPGTNKTLRDVESKSEALVIPRGSIEVQVAPITQCFVEGVEHPDRSRTIYYTPL